MGKSRGDTVSNGVDVTNNINIIIVIVIVVRRKDVAGSAD